MFFGDNSNQKFSKIQPTENVNIVKVDVTVIPASAGMTVVEVLTGNLQRLFRKWHGCSIHWVCFFSIVPSADTDVERTAPGTKPDHVAWGHSPRWPDGWRIWGRNPL